MTPLRTVILAAVMSIAACVFADRPGERVFGPFDGECRGGGPGHVLWFDGLPPIDAGDAWSMAAWVSIKRPPQGLTLVAGFGDGVNLNEASATEVLGKGGKLTGHVRDLPGSDRFLGVEPKGLFVWTGKQVLETGVPLAGDRPEHVAATFDGRALRVYRGGKQVLTKEVAFSMAAAQVLVAPPAAIGGGPKRKGKMARATTCFDGTVARLSIWSRCLTAGEIAQLAAGAGWANARFVYASAPSGPTPGNRGAIFKGCRGMLAPQNPKTLPRPVPAWTPHRKPRRTPRPQPQPGADGDLVLCGGWQLADATAMQLRGQAVSSPQRDGVDTNDWYDAVVPGTVLTTLVEQGVYPDPLHGLNNLVIPDTLWRHNWWYRVEFATPAAWKDRRVELTFHGINYHAEAWLNGRRLGDLTGAFLRGRFDATAALRKDGGKNVLAVRVWGPPHGGWAHEESSRAGTGDNGGQGTLDGPSFFCTEGWDWIPGIRDRATGIWQDVVLHPTGPVALGDPQVTTVLPRPGDLSRADVTVKAEVRNLTDNPQRATLSGSIAGAAFEIPVTLGPREVKTVTVAPAEFPQLALTRPKLWWPNGYGEPTLHELKLQVADAAGRTSDQLCQRVGLRTIQYDTSPSLTVLVNGRRIFCKGGNWGMDDALKRVSPERLEPYFRLHRDAHATMIRNWCGQCTEEAFYQLADQYGILVWNDFWQSTGGYNLEPIDAELFLANAADTVRRYRNHASIAVWCGRNEGTPPWWTDRPLGELLRRLDGTRRYEPCSNSNGGARHLQQSGPYKYQDPEDFFTKYSYAFAVEMGVNSVPEADAIRAMMPPDATWPVSDAWVYHDLHVDGNGDWKVYAAAIRRQYGDFRSLDQFCRKAQMLNYAYYRAMFEGFNAKLWNPCGGLMIWMSHPAWPSTVWQFYTHDYDAHGSYYGVKKASEPVHVQWNLRADAIAVVNNREEPLDGVRVVASVYDLGGRRVARQERTLTAAAQASTTALKLAWPKMPDSPVQFLNLELRSPSGELLSENFYWRSDTPAGMRSLDRLKPVRLDGGFSTKPSGSMVRVTVRLANPTDRIALATRLTLRAARDGSRILPAYYSDNYVSLLPHTERTITIEYPAAAASGPLRLSLDGWNVESRDIPPPVR